MTVKGEQVQPDPQLLFQRQTIIAKNDDSPARLSNMSVQYPTAHFESSILPKIANKTSHVGNC